MSRYIDAEKLKEKLDDFISMSQTYTEYDCGYDDCFTAIQDTLADIPTADVAEVKHGEWKIEEYKNHLNVVCPNCNKEFYVYKQGQYRIDRSNYCPNCGARMDGK